MVGLTNIVNNVLSGAAVARGWEGVDAGNKNLWCELHSKKPPGCFQLGGGFKDFLFSSLLEEDSHFD